MTAFEKKPDGSKTSKAGGSKRINETLELEVNTIVWGTSSVPLRRGRMRVGDAKMSLMHSCSVSPVVTSSHGTLKSSFLTGKFGVYTFPLATGEKSHTEGKETKTNEKPTNQLTDQPRLQRNELACDFLGSQGEEGTYIYLESLGSTHLVLSRHFENPNRVDAHFLNMEQKHRKEQTRRIWLQDRGGRERTKIKEGRSLKETPKS